jgi:hypothetical protein
MDPMEATAKKRGLEMSNKEAPVGFFERIRMGNIDEPGSEAYNRFGAGRGRATPAAPAAEEVRPNPVPRIPPQPNPIFAAGMEQGKRQPYGDASVAEYYANKPRNPQAVQDADNPRVSSPASKPTASASKPTVTTVPRLRTDPSRGDLGNKPSQYAGPLRGMRSDAGTSPPIATHGGPREEERLAKPTMDTKAMNENAKKAMADDPSSLMGMAGAGASALFGASKLGKLFKRAKKATSAGRSLVTSPTAKNTMGKADDAKAAKAYDKLKKSSFTKGDDVTDVTAKKRGGAVKKYASGGMVSSASRRADGIATKGKTRGKIC